MVIKDGAKMSKSKGNVVVVSKLRAVGVDPRAIRLVLLDHHYRTPWDWTDEALAAAQARLAGWSEGVARLSQAQAQALLGQVRAALVDDLDTPAALQAVDAAVAAADGDGTGSDLATDAIDALLGVRL